MNRYLLLIVLNLGMISQSFAQVGGDNVYEFLNLPASARISGAGGTYISVKDSDAAFALANPAVLNPTMHQQLSFNHQINLAGIHNGFFSYTHHVEKWKTTLHGGIQYITYGTFDATDEFGQVQGEFKASEYALTLGAGRQLYDRLSVGANLKMITSQFESFNSFGISTDLAGFYFEEDKGFAATLVLKNIGVQISAYDQQRESIPFEIQLGLSKKLKHLPFRFSVTFHNLNRWNITYDDPNAEESSVLFGDIDGDGRSGEYSFIDNLFRHFIFSGEFIFGKKENFKVQLGYNHFRRRELSVNNFGSLAGFSFGAGMKINRFRIAYGREFYHIAGGINHFSLSTSISEFKR